jgi:thiol-disulfide isomerase/thioredoxin
MKRLILTLFVTSLIFTVFAQDKTRELPSVPVKTLEGNEFNIQDLENDGNPIVISFWATWCKPCIKELQTISEIYPDWVDETGVKIVAVSIDDTRNSYRVEPFVQGRDWEYEVYLDENADLKRALNVGNIPHTFLLNGEKQIVWQHTGYLPGDEDELYEVVTKIANGEPLGDH